MTSPDERGQEIEVMLNRYVKGKMPTEAGKFQWMEFHSSFRPVTTTARGLAVQIWRGWSFCPVFNGRRQKENFKAAWHIALDFDTEDERSSLGYLSELAWIDWFASFGYTTPSHTPEAPKARIVWVFPEPITDLREYEELYKALLHFFPWADQHAKDGLRLYYGSPDCDVWDNWSIFPKPARDVIVDQYRETLTKEPEPERVITLPGNGDYTKYVKAIVEDECQAVKSAPDGARHQTRFKAAINLGNLVSASWAGLSKTDASSALVDAAKRNSDTPEFELRRVIEDGIERGMQDPRPQPVRSYSVASVDEIL